MQKVIFLDLDGTVTTQSTWPLLNLKLGVTPEKDNELFHQYITEKIPYYEWIRQLVDLYKERGEVSKQDLIEFAEAIEIRPEASTLIAALKEKGYTVVLLSGSIDIIVQTIADKVGVDEWIACSKFIFDEKGIMTDIVSSGDEAVAKEILAERYAHTKGIAISDTYSIDDGGNGVELFKKAKGILFGNNEKLKPLAWKQVESLSEIPELL